MILTNECTRELYSMTAHGIELSGCTEHDAHYLVGMGEMYQSRVAGFVQQLIGERNGELVDLEIDTGQLIGAMITKGKYDWVHEGILNARWPMQTSYKSLLPARLISLDGVYNCAEAIKNLESIGLRSLTIMELLTIGCTYPEKQRAYAIIAPGAVTIVDGVNVVPYLSGGSRERKLGLNWVGDGWGEYARFAVTNI